VNGEDLWNIACTTNRDCGLRNIDFGFDCCSLQACDAKSLEEPNWVPVNVNWWHTFHDACVASSASDCGTV
jgi:hypothetical protein